MQNVTELLARFIHELSFDDIPAEAVEMTKKYILDWYSASFAGMKINSAFNRSVLRVTESEFRGADAAPLLGSTLMTEGGAAFINALYAHGADMDDGNRLAMGHIGAHVISAVFAVAESVTRRSGTTKSGKELIVAINAGYEIFNRVAAAAQPGLVKRGFHSTGTAGAIACAAAVAKLLGLSGQRVYDAISLSALQASGLIIIAESGQACKPLNPANAAKTGVFSARLAEEGVKAPLYPLESEKGWLHAMTDSPDLRMITDGLGERFTVLESYLKPYPSCRHTHCAIDAARELRQELIGRYGNLSSDMIRHIHVHIYENAIRVSGQITVPKTDDDTKFSIHYALAKTLENGSFGLEDLRVDSLTAETAALIEKIALIPSPEMEQRNKGIRGAKLSVALRSGDIFTKTVLIPLGDAANPLNMQEMQAKLAACSEGMTDEKQRKKLTENVMALDSLIFTSVNDLLK